MAMILLICLLALSSANFVQSNNGRIQLNTPTSFTSNSDRRLSFDLPKAPTLPLSEADILCKGKPEGFVIVRLGGEKFIVCTTDSKGDEFSCSKGLLYNDETKRCERKYNPNRNPCTSKTCLNGGRCIPTQYSYTCDCSQGFTGRTCELDASVCQQQQPCGSSFDSFCQSFLVGSALKHVCVLQEGRAYGLTGQQAFPNPCLNAEGIHPLAFGNKGFIMCDGERMSIQSCPGGTIWDSLTKVCVWPDIEGTLPAPMLFRNTPLSVGVDRFAFSNDIPAPIFTTPRTPQSDLPSRSNAGGNFGAFAQSAAIPSEDSNAEEFDGASSRMISVSPGGIAVGQSRRVEDIQSRGISGLFQRKETGQMRASNGFPFRPPFRSQPGGLSTGPTDIGGNGISFLGNVDDDSNAKTREILFETPTSATMGTRGVFPGMRISAGAQSRLRF